LVLVLIGVVWMSLGVWAFTNPVGLGEWVDFHLEGATARLEIRAMYGGLSLALAGLHFAGALRTAWARPALVMTMTTLGGLATGRLVSLAVDDFSAIGAGLMASEYTGLALGSVAMARLLRE
jgi:hypothetical protein